MGRAERERQKLSSTALQNRGSLLVCLHCPRPPVRRQASDQIVITCTILRNYFVSLSFCPLTSQNPHEWLFAEQVTKPVKTAEAARLCGVKALLPPFAEDLDPKPPTNHPVSEVHFDPVPFPPFFLPLPTPYLFFLFFVVPPAFLCLPMQLGSGGGGGGISRPRELSVCQTAVFGPFLSAHATWDLQSRQAAHGWIRLSPHSPR